MHDNAFLVAHEVFNRRVTSKREINAEEFARTPTRKRERRFAQRFARNRTGVDTRAANLAKFFYKRDPLPENCGGVSSGDASWYAADHYQVEVLSHRRAIRQVLTKFVAVKLWVNSHIGFCASVDEFGFGVCGRRGLQAAGMRSIRITAKGNSATPKIEKAEVLADRLRS